MFKQYIDCKICKNRVLGNVWHVHVVGKKHMHYTPKKITVTGPFDTNRLDEVHRYFAQFGTIGSKKFTVLDDGKVAIDYCFQDKRSHSKIIYKDHKKFNEQLKITWEEVTETPSFVMTNQRNQNVKIPSRNSGREQEENKHKSEKQPVNDVLSKQAVLESLKGVPTFAEQVLHLQNKLQIEPAETEKKKKIIRDDLTSALQPVFPLSSIYFFGSSVTGLDVRGSDVDVYIANVRESNRPEVATLKLIRHLIFKCRKFCDVLLISGAKTPIIKCIHTKTQICCDLNIKNKLSVCNSQLIRYYLSLDDKIRPLMILIKFWADCYDLKKVNFFSSYALYMMVIFYLQHEPYNIPSVKNLQKNVDPNLVETWNCAFELQNFSCEALRKESMQNLVTGFFKFYSNFDYNSKVIAPYFGSSLDKICFLKPYNLTQGYQEYVNCKNDLVINGGICIQDPFEHSRNVSTSVPLSCAGKFIQMCKTSLQVMEEGATDLLHKILTQKPEFDFSFTFDKPEDADKDEWKKTVEEMTNKVLTEVLAVAAVKTSNQNTITFNCNGKQNIWEGRSNILKNLLTQLPPNIGEMDKEVATTKCIVKYLPQSLVINFVVKISFEESCVKFTLTCRSKKCKNFLHASHFFYVKLKKFLETHQQGGENSSVDFDTDKLSLSDLISPKMLQKEDKTRKETSNEITGKQSTESRNQAADDVQTSEDRTNDDDTSKANEENLEEEEEDIPADFFDDFSNEDFMDGLDIVDAWDEDKLLEVAEEDGSKSPLTDLKSHSPIRFVDKTPEKRSKKYRSRSKSPLRRYVRSNSYRKRSRSRSREKIRLSDRRDPEKTKRDINRDKIKCAKDKEQKIVNDKLRIVETGLVPPGMEMEADITSIIERDRRRSGGSVEKTRDSKHREKRFSRKSSSREMRKTSRYSPSTAPYRQRPRESVYRPRKRTTSVDSNVSDREMWIRSSRKRSRSRSRDTPHHRSRSRDSPHHRSKTKKYEEKKKKTFLEEIRDKLNETRTPLPVVPPTYTMSYPNTVHAIPTPVPVPAPPQFFPQTPTNVPLQQYDQNFFIGDAYQNRQNVMGQPSFNMMGSAGNVMPMHTGQVPHMVVTPTVPVPNPSTVVSPTTKFLNDIAFAPKVADVKKDLEKETNDSIDKLFADKKISLSDFLTITAKCEATSSSPEHLQKKIKVISRCQDAIRSMSDDRKFTGRLAVKATEYKNKTDVKNQSPLRRIPVVRFQFTAKSQEEGDGFASALDNILRKLGVLKDSIDLNSVGELETTNSSFADEETSGLMLKASILNSKKFDSRIDCEECRKRKSRSFADVGSQYADHKETVSVATQVTEEELNPNKGLPKNDSIAYMTPAQLLGKDKDKSGKEGDSSEMSMEKKIEAPVSTGLQKTEKPKPPPFKTRGSFRKTLRDRQPNHYYEYDYENEEYDEFYDGVRPVYEDPRESFGQRYGGPPSRPPHPRGPMRQHFIEDEDMSHLHQFREHDGNFTDFAQPFRGRGRYGPRY